jgi:hypothetical protein
MEMGKARRTSKTKTKPKTAQQRMAARRRRLRAQGLRPVQFWVPDLSDPRVKAQIRKEAALLAKHPENDEIDRWIEAVADLSGWR